MLTMSSPARIDVHHHAMPDDYCADAIAHNAVPVQGKFPPWSIDGALKMMDDHGIQAGIMSVSHPGVRFCNDAAATRAIARRFNEYVAEEIQRRPDRFGAFALIPMHNVEHNIDDDVQDALDEIAYALDVLKLDGVQLFTSYGNRYPGDPIFDPIFQALHERRATVHWHPTLNPLMRQLGLALPGYMLEYMFDTTRAAANFMFSGALDRFSDANIILSHAGGVFPYLAWRVGNTPAEGRPLPSWTPDEIYEKMSRFWYDTALSPGRATMGALREVAAPDRILFGSDWPFAPARKVGLEVDALTQPGLLSPEQSMAINRGNALRLFPRFG
jgi:6-methylsalicylate decarboxylase